MNLLVFMVECRRALSSRRAFAARVLGPLTLVSVVATDALSPPTRSAAYVLLFVGSGMLGTLIPFLRDEESGLATRVRRGGISWPSYLLQRSAAGAALGLLALLPSVAVVVIFSELLWPYALIMIPLLAVTLWVAAVLATVAAAPSRSMSEALLLSGMAFVLLMHASGVFSSPTPGGLAASLEGLSPFCALHEALLAMDSGDGVGGVWAAVVWAGVLPALAALAASRLSGRHGAGARPERRRPGPAGSSA